MMRRAVSSSENRTTRSLPTRHRTEERWATWSDVRYGERPPTPGRAPRTADRRASRPVDRTAWRGIAARTRVRTLPRRRQPSGDADRAQCRGIGLESASLLAKQRCSPVRTSYEPVPPAGLEPATTGLEGPCSVQLSYGGSPAERNRRHRGLPGHSDGPARARAGRATDGLAVGAWGGVGPEPPGAEGSVGVRIVLDARGERTHRVRTAGADRVPRDVGYSRRRDAVGPGESRGPVSQPIGRAGPGPPGNALGPDRVAWESPRGSPPETASPSRVWSSFENSTVC